MTLKVHGAELVGPGWDRVRAIRQRIVGDQGASLDAELIPAEFHDLLPFASLVSTGEEPLAEDYFDALSPEERDAFMGRMTGERAKSMQRWAQGARRCAERGAMFRLGETYKTFARLASGVRYPR